MYMNGTRQYTIKIQSGYITIHQDTYPIGNYTKNDRKPPVTPGGGPLGGIREGLRIGSHGIGSHGGHGIVLAATEDRLPVHSG